jgi:hypothetical protein
VNCLSIVFISIKRSCTYSNYVVLLWNESHIQDNEHSINYTPSTVKCHCEEVVTQLPKWGYAVITGVILQFTKNVSSFSVTRRLLQTSSDLRFSQHENLDQSCLGHDTIQSGKLVPIFWSNLLLVLSVTDKGTFIIFHHVISQKTTVQIWGIHK